MSQKVVPISGERIETSKSQTKASKYAQMMSWLKANHHFAKGEDGNLYVWSNGVFRSDDDDSSLLGRLVLEGMRRFQIDLLYENEMVVKARDHLRRVSPRMFPRPPLGRINVLNGELNLETNLLQPHSPLTWVNHIQLPVMYAPEARCPAWDEFLLDYFDPGPEIDFIHEVIGFCLTPTRKEQVAIWFKGPGANGKSTLVMAIQLLLGSSNTYSFSISSFDNDKFLIADFYGKLLVCDTDTKKAFIKNTDIFKKLVSGDELSAQRKFGHPFNFRPFCKVMFCCNQDIKTEDHSWGYNRRQLVVPMDRSFTGRAKDQDSLLTLLSRPSELSGLLNHAIRGWQRVNLTGKFTIPDKVAQTTARVREKNSTFSRFKELHLSDSPTGSVSRKLLLQTYNRWLLSEGYEETNPSELGRLISHWWPEQSNRRQDGVRVYEGFTLL